MPRSNFIENPGSPGDGYCRVCDYAYSQQIEREVEQHRGYHKRFLRACREDWAPVNSELRRLWMAEGLRMQESPSRSERIQGAFKWFEAHYHDHLARALRDDCVPMFRSEFFTKYMEDRDRLRGNFDVEVAYELRFVYSNHPMYDPPPLPPQRPAV